MLYYIFINWISCNREINSWLDEFQNLDSYAKTKRWKYIIQLIWEMSSLASHNSHVIFTEQMSTLKMTFWKIFAPLKKTEKNIYTEWVEFSILCLNGQVYHFSGNFFNDITHMLDFHHSIPHPAFRIHPPPNLGKIYYCYLQNISCVYKHHKIKQSISIHG